MKHLKHLNDEISLQLLSKKLVILISILSGQRDQTLKVLNIEHIVLEDSNQIEFRSNPENKKFVLLKLYMTI